MSYVRGMVGGGVEGREEGWVCWRVEVGEQGSFGNFKVLCPYCEI